MSADRPDTAHEALRGLAGWLDEADRLIDALAEARHLPRSNSGDGVQQDLRALADWFEGHPVAAAEAWAHVQTVVVTPPAAAVAPLATGNDGAEELRDALLRHHPIAHTATGPFSGCRCGQVKLGQDVIAHVADHLRAALAPQAGDGAR